jgi:hypothetical protein
MKSTIKHLITEMLLAITVLVSGIILGLTIPVTLSALISILTDFTFIQCTSSVGFWVFTILAIVGAFSYINHVMKDATQD